MRILIYTLGFINGGFMLADGLHVLLKGKYIGPEEPGPWSVLFRHFNINVFELGPLFILCGVFWLSWVWMFWRYAQRARRPGMLISVLTLWYLPVGSLFALVILLALASTKVQRSRTV